MKKRRIVILTEGNTHPTPGKTAAGIIRYRKDEVLGVIDSTQAGKDVSELLGVGKGIPVVASLDDIIQLKPDVLLIGISPAGGRLPCLWRNIIIDAIKKGLDIHAGLHMFLADDPEIKKLSEEHNVIIRDFRRVPDNLTVNQCSAVKQDCFRIHTVGSDCNIGKKVVALEINDSLCKRKLDSVFVATGQTGIMISGKGIAIDRVIADFIAGAAERLVQDNADHNYLVIEGQGGITHPLYSGVTLGMLHGFAPQVLILCHKYDRKIMRGTNNVPLLPLKKLIKLYENLTQPILPAKVVGIGLNLLGLSLRDAESEVKRVREELGLPTTDVLRFGAEPLVEAILAYEQEWRDREDSK